MESDAIIQAGAAAFGDGSHPTTAGVLAALEAIDPQAFAPARAADIGAGSGILSISIHQRFGCPVWAGELNGQAIDTLRKNVEANGVDGHIHAVHAAGFDHPELRAAAPFDLIVMNILADPLMALAADAERALATEGVLIISGMLAWQEPQIREAYQSLGLELAARLTLQDWVTLSFVKP